METVKCPVCGEEVIINEGAFGKCACGAIVPGSITKTIEEKRKSKKGIIKFLASYNFFLLVLVALLIFLATNVEGKTPYITIIPVIVFMIFFEIIFIRKYIQFRKTFNIDK